MEKDQKTQTQPQHKRSWAPHAQYRYDLFQKTNLNVEERRLLLENPPPKVPAEVIAYLDAEEIHYKTSQELAWVKGLSSCIYNRFDVIKQMENSSKTATTEQQKGQQQQKSETRTCAQKRRSRTSTKTKRDEPTRGQYTSIKKVIAALTIVQSMSDVVDEEKKLLNDLTVSVRSSWKMYVTNYMKQQQVKEEKQHDMEDEKDIQVKQPTETTKTFVREQGHQQQRTRFVKRERDVTETSSVQLQVKIMQTVQTIDNLPQEKIIEGFQKLTGRQRELNNLQQRTQEILTKHEDAVKKWLALLPKQLFRLNDGVVCLGWSRTRRKSKKNIDEGTERSDQGVRPRITTRWITNHLKEYFCNTTNLSINRAYLFRDRIMRLLASLTS